MAVTTFDAQYSFSQESVARLGDRGVSGKLTEEQQKKLQESKAMQAQRKADELCQQFTWNRDSQRASTDTFFIPNESDWNAPKKFHYERSVDYYEVLGLEELDNLEDVKAAYKKLSLIYHPDKTKGMTPEQQDDYATIFIAVKNAYLVLSDQATRRQYDRDRDHDRAKAEANGYKLQKKATIDLTEVLQRIKEMQRPPGKVRDINLQCSLEKFFYGCTKVIQSQRKVKDFYRGVYTEDHVFRIDLPKAADEPFGCLFKEQGDWQADTKPDTINFEIRAKSHPTVERAAGNDLVLKQEIDLGTNAQEEPFISVDTPSIRGRHMFLWGRNPFFPATGAPDAHLRVRIQGEGLMPDSFLRFTCRLGNNTDKFRNITFTRQTARAYLQELIDTHTAWQRSKNGSVGELWSMLHNIEPVGGKKLAPGDLHEILSIALKQVQGEWGLIAKVSALLSEGNGKSPNLKKFLMRNKLAPTDAQDTEADEVNEDICQRTTSATHGTGGHCDATAMHRRVRRQQELQSHYEVELKQIGDPVPLYTSPTSCLTFYSNAHQLSGAARSSVQQPMFAVSFSSVACAKKKILPEWNKLKEAVFPTLQSTVFHLLRAARGIMPRQLADFPISMCGPAASVEKTDKQQTYSENSAAFWKKIGTDAFKQGDYYTAMVSYSKGLECHSVEEDNEAAAVARSNLAACLAKVGDFEESLAEAKRAVELRPTWGRAWSRVGLATQSFGDEHLQEALDAYFKAVEYDPSGANVEGLFALVTKVRSPDTDSAQSEKEKGNAAWNAKEWGLAIAHYTIAIGLLPAENAFKADPEAHAWLQSLRSVLHSNRGGVYCKLKNWDLAIADGRKAMLAKPSNHKAHNRLGTALLGAGFVEEAYSEFAWALMIDSNSEVAQKGTEACIIMLPLWRSVPALRQRKSRFNVDIGRPKKFTKVYAISDIHFDHRANAEWIHSIDDRAFKEDVLIIAGNIADTLHGIRNGLRTIKSKFRRVFYTPGNHDVWMNPGEVRYSQFPDSFSKFLAIVDVCEELGVDTGPAAVANGLYILPFFSWYNAEFDKKSRPDPNHGHDAACVWPLDPHRELWKYMLKLNEKSIERQYKGTVISFSHFVPLSALPYSNDNKAGQAMGCEDLEDQIRMVRSSVHVYGHSANRTAEEYGKVLFVNNYFGYLGVEGSNEGPSVPLCIFDGEQGVIVKDRRQKDGGGDE